MIKKIKISVVSPVYMAEKIIEELCFRLIKNLSEITDQFEIILVEDGSPDNSWEKICEVAQKEKRIKGVKLSRNFGQQNAIISGLKQSAGEWIIVMDCDLQDNPAEIINLYKKVIKGYDIVFARRVERQDKIVKKLFAKLFYKIFSYFSGDSIDGSIANFGIYNKKVIKAINEMQEPFSIFSVTTRWIGFKNTYINTKHGKRFEGKSSYSFKKLITFALDYALTYSQKPLKITITLGFFITLISIITSIYFIFSYFNGTITQPGFTSIILSIWFFSGLTIFTMGIIGLYIGKTFENSKNKPRYIIEEKIN